MELPRIDIETMARPGSSWKVMREVMMTKVSPGPERSMDSMEADVTTVPLPTVTSRRAATGVESGIERVKEE